RREFNLTAGSVIALTVLDSAVGCGKSGSSQGATGAAADQSAGQAAKVVFASEPFLAGTPDTYAKAGTYDAFKDKGIFIVSDFNKLFASYVKSTHNVCPVNWLSDTTQYFCPCHRSTFPPDGAITSDSQRARRPLERCTIKLVDGDSGKQVQIDP